MEKKHNLGRPETSARAARLQRKEPSAGEGRNTQRTISVTRDDNQRREAQEACAWIRNISPRLTPSHHFHHFQKWRTQTVTWNTN